MADQHINDEETFRNHRELLQKSVQSSWKAFDKMLMTLTGGSLGISFAFIKDIVKVDPATKLRLPPEWVGLLWSGWSMLSICLGISLLSHYWSALAFERDLERIDAKYMDLKASESVFKKEAQKWNKRVRRANFACCILLVSGIASLLIFAIQNL